VRPAMFRASRHGVLFQVPQLVSASLTDHDARCSLEQHHGGDVPWRQRDRLCTSSVQTDLSESCRLASKPVSSTQWRSEACQSHEAPAQAAR